MGCDSSTDELSTRVGPVGEVSKSTAVGEATAAGSKRREGSACGQGGQLRLVS